MNLVTAHRVDRKFFKNYFRNLNRYFYFTLIFPVLIFHCLNFCLFKIDSHFILFDSLFPLIWSISSLSWVYWPWVWSSKTLFRYYFHYHQWTACTKTHWLKFSNQEPCSSFWEVLYLVKSDQANPEFVGQIIYCLINFSGFPLVVTLYKNK